MTQPLLAAASSPHFHLAWGDVPTWLLVLGAFVAGWAALRQLAVQLADSVRRTAQLERQQANNVDFSWVPGSRVGIFKTGQTDLTEQTDSRIMLIVRNNSRRPIRNVTCRINQGQSGHADLMPVLSGAFADYDAPIYDYILIDPEPKAELPLLRAEHRRGFVFDYDAIAAAGPGFYGSASFIDDADLPWRIDQDMHLTKVSVVRPRWQRVLRLDAY